MAEAFLSEIRIFSFSFAPKGWAFCDGTLLQKAQNEALFSLIGTYYGGNGVTTFALPDLRGRIPLHHDNAFAIGGAAGQETHSLSWQEMPLHLHSAHGQSGQANQTSPVGNTWGSSDLGPYSKTALATPLHQGSISVTGNNKPHPNVPPYLVLNFCICLNGLYPSKT